MMLFTGMENASCQEMSDQFVLEMLRLGDARRKGQQPHATWSLGQSSQ